MMIARAIPRRSLGLWTALAALALLVAAPAAGGEVARVSDKAGQDYAKAIAQAKQKRAAKLKTCAAKRTKAKRRTCRKAADANFDKAEDKAAAKRDAARQEDDSDRPKDPREARDKYKECLRENRDPRECKSEVR